MSRVSEDVKASGEPNNGDQNPNSSKSSEEESKEDKTFECNICLDTAKDAVVSLCGHLFW